MAPTALETAVRTVVGVVDEVDCKAPGYFARAPLRLTASAGLCRALGEALEVRVEPAAPLTAVDRYLAELLGPAPLPAAADPGEVRAVARSDLLSRRRARERAAGLPGRLERRVAASAIGPVPYVTSGAGARPLIVLNAIGQGLDAWYPLIERLEGRRRVIAWELPPALPDGRPPALDDYVSALDAIAEREAGGECDLLGWCAGAKIAVAYCLRHPARVRSVLVLNGSFKHPDRSPALDSAYERELESVCAAVCRRPARAATLRHVIAASAGAPARAAGDEDVLAATAPALREAVVQPFADDARLLAYARAHLAYWDCDVLAGGRDLAVPVVLAAGEHDRFVTAEGVRDAARRLPAARFVRLPGASHHRMYDRPDLVAGLLDEVAAA